MHEFSKWLPHPWHGLTPGTNAPSEVNVFIEITPYDTMKYELDKSSGFLRIDRSQLTSSLPPSLYGFIPQTFSGKRVSKLMNGVENGDYDPMDICVLCERPIARAEVLITANVVGGIPMIDGGLADDKIIAILQSDPVLGHIKEIEDVPEVLLNRLYHYFSTYKKIPNYKHSVNVGKPYGRTHAEKVIRASIEDYKEQFKIKP